MSDEKVFLSYEQAVSLLPDGDDMHVFLNPNGMLLGADWSRKAVLDILHKGECQIGGDMCISMGHGLVCTCDGRYHFVKTRPPKQWSADLQQLTAPCSEGADAPHGDNATSA